MRFYSAIRIEPEKHLQEICENPYLVFSTDFMYYLAALHEVDWRPIKIGPIHNSYSPHPLSPCTKNVKKAMQYILARSKLAYDLLYDELVPCEAENKLELFTIRIKNILDNLIDDPFNTFFILLHVGRWTIQFYKYGTKDAANLAPHLMAHSLKKIAENSRFSAWFNRFDFIAQDLIELYNSGFKEELYEEYFPYYEDLDFDEDESDEDEFGESNICVCGYCDICVCGSSDDQFEDAEEDDDFAPDIYDGHDLYGEFESNKTDSEENLEVIEGDEENKD